ncbi:MAG: bile acid:sodium symporter [Hydrocarboniphaga sp.]|uniref:bile acid:sodium symporter family protein n=1 Tax=Hydrocarboniphaga sp. TaxID=2033016 RepID=UPI00260DE149|nr:bile acid:sodium symporter family protein [Hydrocarboniphaga sp.]MDB5970045.1 bile acid:sodium symporter [Hydrocarboniphaga sp.]
MNTQFFPLVIGVVMLSLGLSLTLADFRRAAQIPRPIMVALFCQTVVLPAICFLIANLFSLPPALAVGLMLVAAAPGGAFANIFSHLADGDLALNLTLTAINSVLSIVTLPLIVALSMSYFMDEGRTIPLQYGKVIQLFAIIVAPVTIGMLLRHRFPHRAERLRGPVKLIAGIVVLAVGVLALVTGWDTLAKHFAILGMAVLLLNIISLVVGYAVPRLMHLGRSQAIAISIEIGLHNAALAITIGSSPQLLGNADMAVPAALYGTIMPFVAACFILVVNRINRGDPASTPPSKRS